MEQSKKRTVAFVSCSFIFLLIGMILAVKLGSVSISFSNIWDSVFNYSQTLELMLIRDVRIPRVLSVLFTGGILGMTGAMIQGVTRNPIAEPSILGVSQGATLLVAIFYSYSKCNDSFIYRSIYNRNYSFNVYIKEGK